MHVKSCYDGFENGKNELPTGRFMQSFQNLAQSKDPIQHPDSRELPFVQKKQAKTDQSHLNSQVGFAGKIYSPGSNAHLNVHFLRDGQQISMFQDEEFIMKNFNTYDLTNSLASAEASYNPRKLNERLPTKINKNTIAYNPYFQKGPRFERVLKSLSSGKNTTSRQKSRKNGINFQLSRDQSREEMGTPSNQSVMPENLPARLAKLREDKIDLHRIESFIKSGRSVMDYENQVQKKKLKSKRLQYYSSLIRCDKSSSRLLAQPLNEIDEASFRLPNPESPHNEYGIRAKYHSENRNQA